jgi:lysozyme family protein
VAKGNFNACLAEILKHEGGFVNHSRDPGGMTNLGVTKQTYEEWVGHPVSEQIMRKLTPQLVSPLYKVKFWDTMKCENLPKGLDLCVFDFGVNAGVRRSVRMLQRLLRVEDDGIIGPATLAAVEARKAVIGSHALIAFFQAERRVYYKSLPHFPTFGRGWLRRVDAVEKTAKAMVR